MKRTAWLDATLEIIDFGISQLPFVLGLLLLTLDVLFWILIVIGCVVNPVDCHDAFMVVYVFHLPSSSLLAFIPPVIWDWLVPIFGMDMLVPQGTLLFIFGTAQYFFGGWLVGYVVRFVYRKVMRISSLV